MAVSISDMEMMGGVARRNQLVINYLHYGF